MLSLSLLTDEWIKMLWYIYTVDYHSAVKGARALTQATTRVDFENTMLSEKQLAFEAHMVSESIHMKCPEQANLRDRK